VVFDEDVDVDLVLREVCLEIALRYEITFLEIGTDGDHVHFLVQSVPSYALQPDQDRAHHQEPERSGSLCPLPQVKKKLWGGQFWSDGFYIASVGQHANADTIGAYVRGQEHPTTTRGYTLNSSPSSSRRETMPWTSRCSANVTLLIQYLAACRGDSLFTERSSTNEHCPQESLSRDSSRWAAAAEHSHSYGQVLAGAQSVLARCKIRPTGETKR
jgi:REP element-mobilizing transposase RayT